MTLKKKLRVRPYNSYRTIASLRSQEFGVKDRIKKPGVKRKEELEKTYITSKFLDPGS